MEFSKILALLALKKIQHGNKYFKGKEKNSKDVS